MPKEDCPGADRADEAAYGALLPNCRTSALTSYRSSLLPTSVCSARKRSKTDT